VQERWRAGPPAAPRHCQRPVGRGITLIPSHFCWGLPVTLADPTLRSVLAYPVPPDPFSTPTPASPPAHGVRTLLGATRFAVLRNATIGSSTTELARRTGISPATASHHTTVLREAGLITSHRNGNLVVHTITPLGYRLMHAGLAAGQL